jgi:tetratricopeptide (TPR) repeat protein
VAPAAALVLASLAAYYPAWDGAFVWDDDYHVTDNLVLRDLRGLREIWLDPRSTQQYYPLTHTSFWLDYQLWGLQPLGYHLVNASLHAASAVLAALVLRRLAVPGAWLAAGLFALHPIQAESVAWITERKNVLSGVFFLSAALAYTGSPLHREGPLRRRATRAALVALLFACALLAKSATAPLPLALAVVTVWKRGSLDRLQTLLLGGLLAGGAAMGLVTLQLEVQHAGARGAEFSLSMVERALVAGRAFWFYLGKLAWPVDLAFSYSRWTVDARDEWAYLFPLGAAAAVALLALFRRKLGAGPVVAVAYFGLMLSPALGLFNVYYHRYAFVADHFQYLACLGPLALLAAGATRLRLPVRLGRATACALLAVLAVLTWNRAALFESSETLWRGSLAADPRSHLAHYNLGELLARKGEIEAAVEHYRRALEIKPDMLPALINLGALLGARGETDEALGLFDRALSRAPDHALAHYNRGLVLELQGRTELALRAYREALRHQPDLVAARNNLALLLYAAGDYRGAWLEVHRLKKDGAAPDLAFLRQLSDKLADPGEGPPRESLAP